MKHILLSTATIMTLATTGGLADTASEIAELKVMMKQMSERLAKLEAENAKLKAEKKPVVHKKSTPRKYVASSQHVVSSKKENEKIASLEKKVETLEAQYGKETPTFSKASKLEFSGLHYIGFVSNRIKDTSTGGSYTDNYFETRRNYLQVKGYFFEDPKSYIRVTLDTTQITSDGANQGDWEVRLKYAYLYINEILPFTGAEFGQSHRPWIDYEEHHGWFYRSIAKTFVEEKQDADFTNSADLGVNFKTKLDYFSSEIGVFNGEGYHGIFHPDDEEDNGLSLEWRLTANLLGTGKKHVGKSDTYADVSFYGQYNTDYDKKGDEETGDFVWYGFNAIYNQPEFLIAANYLKSTEANEDYKGDGYSVNGELRLLTFDESLSDWNIIGRYDRWSLDSFDEPRENTIAGLTYEWNKNVEFIGNYLGIKDPRTDSESDRFMFTSEVKW